MTPIQYNDGGRMQSPAHASEKLDCVVRAIAIAFDIQYSTAHWIAESQFARKPGHKTKWKNWVPWMEKHCIERKEFKPRRTVEKFLQQNPEGRWVCRIRGHAFAVIDGIIHDITRVPPKARIVMAWRVEGSQRVL